MMRYQLQTQLATEGSHDDKGKMSRPASGLFWVLLTMFCLTLISPCLAIEFNSQQPQHTLHSALSSKPKLEWESCGELNDHAVECATLDVPMDHFSKKPSDKTFSIPLIRLLGTSGSASDRKAILLNPGGPGGSGINFFWRAAGAINKVVGETFDLLTFDPRGVNGSRPVASCYPTPEQRALAIETVPWHIEYEAGEMFTKAENKAKACIETMGEHGYYMNTPQTAADMNTILEAIGQKEMYYWGFSYGTTLGQTYAQMFPGRVTRLVIDGVSNLNDWYTKWFETEALVDTDKIFASFVEECFAVKEKCPLNSIKEAPFSTAADLKTHIDDFLEKLGEEPIPVYLTNTNYGAVTRQSIETNGIFPACYKPLVWPILAQNLAELLKGNATPAYIAYSDNWVASIISDETGDFVVQNDNIYTGSSAPFHGIKSLQNFTINAPQLSSLVSKYLGSDIFTRASWSIPTTHKFRPQYHPEFPRFKTKNPILVLSTTWDPVCPLISAKKAHDSFEGAGFVEQRSYGHCSLSMPSLCTAKHVRAYFTEGLLPERDAICDIDGDYFPGTGKTDRSTLSAEDGELLVALQDLAGSGIFDDLPSRRTFKART